MTATATVHSVPASLVSARLVLPVLPPLLALASLSLTASGRQYRIIKGTIDSLAPPHSRRFPPFPQHRTATHRTAALQPLFSVRISLPFFNPMKPLLFFPLSSPLCPISAFVTVSAPVSASPSAPLPSSRPSEQNRTSRPHYYKPSSNTIPHSLTPPHPVASSTPATLLPSFPTTTCATSRYPAARSGQLASPPLWQAVRVPFKIRPIPAVQPRPRASAKTHT